MSITNGHGGHEERDIDISGVTKAGLAITAGVFVSVFLMWFLFDRFDAREREATSQP